MSDRTTKYYNPPSDMTKWTQNEIHSKINENIEKIDALKEAARGLDPKTGKGKELWDGIKHRENENATLWVLHR